MKNSIKIFAICFFSFIVGSLTTNYAISAINGSTLAVVDVQKVVSASKEVASLRTEQQKKMQDLNAWVQTSQKQLLAEKDDTKKAALEKKLNKQFQEKKESIEKSYAEKLAKIDKNITGIISNKAKAKGFDVVLAKSVVLYGGTDLTQEVVSSVK